MSRSRPVRAALVLLVLVVAAAGIVLVDRAGAGAPGCGDSPASHADEVVTSPDGTSIAVTVFRPAGTCARHPTPVVLAAHPWGSSRWTGATLTDPGRAGRALRTLLGAGFGVVGVDARGHGSSGGTSRFHHPVSGVADFRAVIDHVAKLPWVASDDGDPRIGVLGSSFGGAITLLLAAADARVDAAVPMVTWSDLPRSLAPGGRVRAEVIDALLDRASRSVRVDPGLLAELAAAKRTGVLGRGLAVQFALSSPSRVLGSVHVPVYVVHALDDDVFAFDEAIATYTQLRAARNDVRLLGYPGGHSEPDVFPSVTRVAGADCDGALEIVTFLNAALRGDGEARSVLASTAPVTVARPDGTCWSGDVPPVR